jgi:hypothetical protein
MAACYDTRHFDAEDRVEVSSKDGDDLHTVTVKAMLGPELDWTLTMFFPSNEEREAFLRQCAALLKEASDGPQA